MWTSPIVLGQTQRKFKSPESSALAPIEIVHLCDALPGNRFISGRDRSVGILAAGIALNYLNECSPDGCPQPVLRVGHQPVAPARLAQLHDACDSIPVLEKGAPLLEEQLVGPFPNLPGAVRGA